MNLEKSAASLLEQFPAGDRLDLKREEQMLEKFGKVAFTGFGIVIAIAIASIIYYIATKMIVSGSQPLAGVLLIAFIIFAGLALGYVFWQESLKEKRKKHEATPARDLRSAQTGKLLPESDLEPVPISVVEGTTDLLPAKKPGNRGDDAQN